VTASMLAPSCRAVGAELPWGIGVCAFTLAPDHPEVLLVPDMKADARFNSMCAVESATSLASEPWLNIGYWKNRSYDFLCIRWRKVCRVSFGLACMPPFASEVRWSSGLSCRGRGSAIAAGCPNA